MQWITAIAAFAVTMFTLSVIVSVMVETVHRILRSRHKGLMQLIEKLYVHSIAPRLEPAAGGTMTPRQFAVTMTENRAAGQVDSTKTVVANETGRLHSIDSMPVEVFTQKLADMKMRLKDLNLDMETVVADIAAKYVTFGQEQSVAFERRSRTLAVVCAMLLAVVAYVHPLNLADVYLKNPELAERVASKSEDIEEDLETLNETIEELRAEVPAGQPTLETASDEIATAMDDVKARLDSLKAEGVPLGWPKGAVGCGDGKVFVENCLFSVWGLAIPIPSGVNFIWLMFGGLLVGLGAPFWQQVITSVAATNTITQKLASIVGGTAATRGATLAAVAAAPTRSSLESTAVRTFTVATNAGPVQDREAASNRP